MPNLANFAIDLSAQPEPQRIELEGATQDTDGFVIKSYNGASEGSFLQTKSFNPQIASFDFDGVSGLYDLALGAFDESDGQSTINIQVNGTSVGIVTLDQDPAGPTANRNSFTLTDIADVALATGDRVSLHVQRDGGEPARLDFLDIVPDDFLLG